MPSRRQRQVLGLVAVQFGDAAFNAVPTQWLKDDLDHLGVPEDVRFIFPVIKSASAVGLLAGMRWPRLGRLTAAALVAYFVVAMGFHARAKDPPRKYAPAAGMLGWSIAAFRAFRVGD
jgi:hypothetical protein